MPTRNTLDRPSSEPVDLLTLWRTRPPPEAASEDAQRLAQVLLARARAQTWGDDWEQQVLRAEGRDPRAWLALADKLPAVLAWASGGVDGSSKDCRGSCLWVAAWHGSKWARLMLTLWQVWAGVDQEVIRDTMRGLPLTEVLPRAALAAMDTLEELPGYQEFRQARRDQEVSADAVTGNGSARGDSLRVLDSAPVAATARDDKAVMEHYARLAKPIPLMPCPHPDEVAEVLTDEFPWFSDLIEAIRIELTLARNLGRRHAHLRPMLIHGPSGVGKTRFIGRLAAALGLPMGRIMAAGSADNRRLAGTARGWASAQPSLPLVVMRQHLVANPVILVDEVDKASLSDHNGRIVDTLTSMLDPETARRWPDECLLAGADLSAVTWILLCNHIHRVPPVLRARCRIMRVGRPRAEHFDTILRAIRADIAGEFDVDPILLPPLDPEVVEAMRAGFRRGQLQPRQLAALVRQSLAVAATIENQACH